MAEGTLEYKGFIGSVSYSAVDEVYHGKLEGITDLISFEAADVNKMKEAFQEAVEDYLEICEVNGKAKMI